MSGRADDEADDEGAVGETDHGVPFPGVAVPPERRTDAHVVLPRSGSRAAAVDWAGLFGRRGAPRVVDLGCGNGRYLLGSALARPDHDHLGVDLVPQSIRHAARRAGERGLGNVKYAWGDALDLLFQGLEPGTIDELHVYHPQPFYDAEKVGKRLLTPAFFGRAWAVLRKPVGGPQGSRASGRGARSEGNHETHPQDDARRGGERGFPPADHTDGLLVLQTDNPYYWRYVSNVAPRLFRWREHPDPWPDMPEGRSRREVFARSRGLTIFRGLGLPRAISPHRVRQLVRHMPRPTFDANRPRFRRGG